MPKTRDYWIMIPPSHHTPQTKSDRRGGGENVTTIREHALWCAILVALNGRTYNN